MVVFSFSPISFLPLHKRLVDKRASLGFVWGVLPLTGLFGFRQVFGGFFLVISCDDSLWLPRAFSPFFFCYPSGSFFRLRLFFDHHTLFPPVRPHSPGWFFEYSFSLIGFAPCTTLRCQKGGPPLPTRRWSAALASGFPSFFSGSLSCSWLIFGVFRSDTTSPLPPRSAGCLRHPFRASPGFFFSYLFFYWPRGTRFFLKYKCLDSWEF